MAIAASGAVSFSDLRTEYGASGAVSFSDFYRGAASGYVRSLAANNTATNLSASVPASGTINFTNFRSQARGFRFTFTGNATNQNASTLFGTDWGVDYPKDIVINSGVTIGGTSASEEALEISTGGLGTITITNNGTLIGAGGAANGGNGGDAFEAFVTCTLVNNGSILAGGGGGAKGGNGGTGGGGQYTSTAGSAYYVQSSSGGLSCNQISASNCPNPYGGFRVNIYAASCQNGMEGGATWKCYGQLQTTTNTNGGSGGTGGSGGLGAGYNQNAGAGASGNAGSNGGTNAGAGGSGASGASGGGYGQNGSSASNGNAGANGNRTNGSAGSAAGSAGAAGAAIRGNSYVTLTNNATITGGQV